MIEKQKDPEKIKDRICYWIGKINVWFMLVLFPVILTDKLNNVTKTRYISFCVISFLSFLLYIINDMVYEIRVMILSKRLNQEKKSKFMRAFSYKNILGMISIVFALITYIASPFKRYALAGAGNRYIGLIYILALVCEFITVSNCYQFQKRDVFFASITGTFVNALAILNYCGIDLFDFFTNLEVVDQKAYISTMGNVDVYGIYAVMITAICIYLTFKSNHTMIKICYFTFSMIGIMGVAASGSDAAFLGLVVFYIVLFFMMCSSLSDITDWLIAVLMFCFAENVMKCLHLFIQCRKYEGIFPILDRYNGFWMILVLFVLIIVFSILSRIWHRPFDKRISRIIRIVYIGAFALIIASIFAVIVIHTRKYAGTSVDGLNKYFVFSDTWGSGRGFIWKNLMDGYVHMPFLNQVFGMGHATIASVLSHYSSGHWNLLNGQVVDNAHNVYLHILITTGIAGIVVFLNLIICTIKNVYVTVRHTDPQTKHLYFAVTIAVICTLCQLFFCLFEVITFPILVCLAAMLNSEQKMDKKYN